MRATFVNLLRESVSYSAMSLLGFDKKRGGGHQKHVNIKRDHNGSSDEFLLNCNIAWKKHTAHLASGAQRGGPNGAPVPVIQSRGHPMSEITKF